MKDDNAYAAVSIDATGATPKDQWLLPRLSRNTVFNAGTYSPGLRLPCVLGVDLTYNDPKTKAK